MTGQRPSASAPPAKIAAEDDFTRLVRALARQAARETFKALLDEKAPEGPGRPAIRSITNSGSNKDMVEPDNGAEFEERFFPVALVAEKLAISQKSVRRKIAIGELPAHRVGKLLRIGERDLVAYLVRCRLDKRQSR